MDLYSGLTYAAIGVPTAMFPVMFALARSAGWIAQWLEMVRHPEQRTVRPRQIYTGERPDTGGGYVLRATLPKSE